MNRCSVCEIPCDKKCSLCQKVFYCSREHQKQDWKRHKATCICYKVEENEELGRHLVATRRIQVGELIFKEAPLISAPTTRNACVACYIPFSAVKKSIKCPKCDIPLCSANCPRLAEHTPECYFTAPVRETVSCMCPLQRFDVKHETYRTPMYLRSLYLKLVSPREWKKLNSLRLHSDSQEKFKETCTAATLFFRKNYKLKGFSDDEIEKVVGIIASNALTVKNGELIYESVYELSSNLQHDCQANCSVWFLNSRDIVIRAAKTIQPGEHLTKSYGHALGAMAERRFNLKAQLIDCKCKRCCDPTECDTHFSSFKCREGTCQGFVVPILPLQAESTDWQCQTCSGTVPSFTISFIITHASLRLSGANGKALKVFLKDCEPILHSNHYLNAKCKQALTKELHKQVHTLSDEDLRLHIRYSKELVNLYKRLVPAEIVRRASLQAQLKTALEVELSRKKSMAGRDFVTIVKEHQEVVADFNLLTCDFLK